MVMCENYIKCEPYISLYIVRIYHIGHSRVIICLWRSAVFQLTSISVCIFSFGRDIRLYVGHSLYKYILLSSNLVQPTQYRQYRHSIHLLRIYGLKPPIYMALYQ